MTTARDIMHVGAECIGEHETVARVARQMRDLDVGALPICRDDDRLTGIITDRDIVIRCVAAGRDPQTSTARDLALGTPYTIDAGRRRVAGPAGNGGAPDRPPAGDRQPPAGRHDQRGGCGAEPAGRVSRRVHRGDLRGLLTGRHAISHRVAGWSGGDVWRWPGRPVQAADSTKGAC